MAEEGQQRNHQAYEVLQHLRPSKLPTFSGDVGSAEAFIREAKTLLQLQPLPNQTAAAWILSALEGRARQEVLALEAADINSPQKIFDVLEQHWGEQRDTTTLAGAFFKRQQGLSESVAEYAGALRLLWCKTNATNPNTLSEIMLRDSFANGLHPMSFRKDIRQYIRQTPESTFEQVKKEALRWMREDAPPETISQEAIATSNTLQRLEEQVASLLCETASLKQQLQHRPPVQQAYNDVTGPRQEPRRSGLTCWWCQRRGHRETECRTKQRYLERQATAGPGPNMPPTLNRQQENF